MIKFIVAIISLSCTIYASAQIDFKRKAEKKADQVIDDFLFGKKKKSEPTSQPTSYPTSSGNDSGGTYTPQEVDFGTLDMGSSIDFKVLMNILPETTQGFVREGDPDGSRYQSQGMSFSTASKSYKKGDRALEITLIDYLGAEFIAQSQMMGMTSYESTEGYIKQIPYEDGMTAWINMEYQDNSGTMIVYASERFYTTIESYGTNEEELKAIADDINLSRLKTTK